MTEFLVALAIFVAAHLIPATPRLRAGLIVLLGRSGYLAAFSLLSLLLLGWVVLEAQRADAVWLWDPAPWQWLVPFLAMPVAVFLVVAGLIEPNALSISLRNGTKPGAIVSVTRHPVLWGFLIWALSHIPPNGTLVALIMFGGMALFSAAGFRLLDRKARRRLGEERWRSLSAGTSVVPFAALVSGRSRPARPRPLILAGVVTLALYGWFVLQGHGLLIGIDPMAGLP
jgi:uncharacterized membrane protein